MTVTPLVPLCRCKLCGAEAIVELTPEQRLAQPDDTTHVCHPALGGCNHGFTDERTREPRGASYGWIITKDLVTSAEEQAEHSRVNWVGPRDISPETEKALKAGKGQSFRMYDDDGNLYYEGRYLGPNDETAFAPLDDLGTPDAGAVRIDYREGRKWVTL